MESSRVSIIVETARRCLMARRLIRGKMVIDCTGRPPIRNGAVLIEADRIVSVGKSVDFSVKGVEIVDCGDQTLLPGLIDCHNHLSLDTRLKEHLHHMADSVPELTLRAVETLQIDLFSGVTTSRCCGDKEFIDIACRHAVERGKLPGPRLLAATRGIRASHGHGYVGYPFNGPEAIRSAVRENLKAGADFIKLYLTGTLKGKSGLPCYLSKPEISLAVEEAHRAGVKVAAHCIGGPGLDWALDLGIDSIEHAYCVSDAQIERLNGSESLLVMTPSPFFAEDRIVTLPAGLDEGFRGEKDLVADRLAAVIGSGVPFGIGTDGRHGGLAQEMRYLKELGASAEAVLMAGTRTGAKVCGLEGEVGTLETGKIADMIGLKGNPLEDVRAFQEVETVICRGELVLQKNR